VTNIYEIWQDYKQMYSKYISKEIKTNFKAIRNTCHQLPNIGILS